MAALQRVEFVDRLRGTAVLAMFFVHTAGAWLTPEARDGGWWKWSMQVSGMVAPVFLFLVGVSLSLAIHKANEKEIARKQVTLKLLLRGGKILVLGYVLHTLFWTLGSFHGPWQKILKVDILHAIGLCIALLPVIAWPKREFNAKALALYLGIPVLGLIGYNLPLENWLPEALEAYVSTRPRLALFPFIPYATWGALGLFIGPLWLNRTDNRQRLNRFWVWMIVASFGMVVLSVLVSWVYCESGLQRVGRLGSATKGLVHVFYLKTAFVLLLFSAYGLLGGFLRKTKLRFEPLLLFGRTSLFCYCVHLTIVYHLGGRPYLGKLGPTGHLLGALILSILMYGLALLWSRIPKIGSR